MKKIESNQRKQPKPNELQISHEMKPMVLYQQLSSKNIPPKLKFNLDKINPAAQEHVLDSNWLIGLKLSIIL